MEEITMGMKCMELKGYIMNLRQTPVQIQSSPRHEGDSNTVCSFGHHKPVLITFRIGLVLSHLMPEILIGVEQNLSNCFPLVRIVRYVMMFLTQEIFAIFCHDLYPVFITAI